MRLGKSIEERHGINDPGYQPKPQATGTGLVRTVTRGVLGLVVLAVVVGVVAGVAHKSSQASTSPRSSNNGANATLEKTPHVGPTGSVEVDDLRWQLVMTHPPEGPGITYTGPHPHSEPEVQATTSLGEPESTITPNGVFVIVHLQVTSHRSESALLTDDTVSLDVAGRIYKPSLEAEEHLSGEHTLFALEIGPNLTTQTQTVFDVPRAALAEHPELRFNELGFGTAHGYIALPQPSAQ